MLLLSFVLQKNVTKFWGQVSLSILTRRRHVAINMDTKGSCLSLKIKLILLILEE